MFELKFTITAQDLHDLKATVAYLQINVFTFMLCKLHDKFHSESRRRDEVRI